MIDLKWLPVVIATASLINHAKSETAYTEPIGGYVIKVPGREDGEQSRRIYFGIQLLPEKKFSGLVAGVNGNVISLGSVGNHTAFETAGHKSYLHILSGNSRGFVSEIEQFTSSHLQCADDLGNRLQPGHLVAVRPHPNLADLFGATNTYHLSAGPDASSSDNVILWDASVQRESIYYYNSSRSRWEEAGIETDAGNTPVRYPYGLYVLRRSTGTLRIALSGSVASDPVLLPVKNGRNIFSLPVNLSASLGLVATTGDHAVLSGASARTADLLVFEEPTSGLRRGPFYFSSRFGASGWREVGVNGGDASSASLDLLSTLVLQREGNAGYVFVDGNVSAGQSFPPLPADSEPGEVTLEFVFPQALPPSLTLMVQTSQDLQSWTNYMTPVRKNGSITFSSPAGQSRAFYRLKVSMP